MNLENNTRSCGECTKCCDGWFSGEIKGYAFGNIDGKRVPCNFVSDGAGCTIYEQRPKSPCRNYKCEWLKNPEVPDHFKPSISNVMVTRRGFSYYVITKAGDEFNNEVIEWWTEYCKINNFKLDYDN